MPSSLYLRESSEVIVAVECRPAKDTNWSTKLSYVNKKFRASRQATQDLPMLCKIPDKRLQGGFIKSLSHPVERGTQIVHQLLSRMFVPNLFGKSSSFRNARICGFEPEQVGIWSKFDSTFCRRGNPSFVMVKAFPSSRYIVGPDHW